MTLATPNVLLDTATLVVCDGARPLDWCRPFVPDPDRRATRLSTGPVSRWGRRPVSVPAAARAPEGVILAALSGRNLFRLMTEIRRAHGCGPRPIVVAGPAPERHVVEGAAWRTSADIVCCASREEFDATTAMFAETGRDSGFVFHIDADGATADEGVASAVHRLLRGQRDVGCPLPIPPRIIGDEHPLVAAAAR